MKDRFIVPSQWHSVSPISYGHHECPPGYAFGPAVRTHYLLHYVLSGSGFLEKSGQQVSVSTGDIFVILPGEITTYGTSTEDPWTYCWLGFTASGELACLSTPVIRQPPVRHIFQQITDCCDLEYPDAKIFSLTFELLYLLSREKTGVHLGTADAAVYVKTYLENSYMRKIDIAQLADTLHIDRRYLTHIFKKHYGIPPQAYLTQLRLEKAKEFLQAGYNVSSAASMSGFSDVCNFSRKYKAFFGVSPRSHIMK